MASKALWWIALISATAPVAPATGQVETRTQTVASAQQLVQMANALADLKRFDEAITAYSLALQQMPKSGEIYANRALAYAWINHVDEASSDLKMAEHLLPDSAILHRVRAIIANRRSDERLELAELTKSLEFEPHNPFALTFRAHIYQGHGQYTEALQDADALIRVQPNEPYAYEMKARLLGEQRRWSEATAIAESLKLRFPVEPRALASAAQIFRDAGNFTQAMGTIDHAIQLNNNLYILWDQRAEVRRPDDYLGRQSDLETALRLAPGDLGLITKLGLAAFDQGKWSDAKERFTQVINQEPKDFGLLAYRALAFLKLDAPDNAANDYKAALAVASGPGDFNRICGVFAREGIATDWALATCDKAVTAQPDKPYFRVNRGLARLRANDVAGARSDFDIAIAKDANSSEAYYGRAVASLRSGEQASAVKDRQTALSIDPNVDEYFIAHRMSDLRTIM